MPRTYATRHEVPEVKSRNEPKGKKTSVRDQAPKQEDGRRETVEAITVAFILMFLVRGFEAEAFVIATGSMAPTLRGLHKEVPCPQCGHVYAVNASEESVPGSPVYTGICVNCRFQARIDEMPTFKGDRILVEKAPYELSFLPGASEPRRWDVVVFHYPEEPATNYIKRLIGLPGDTMRIWQGDLYVKPTGAGAFQIARNPLRHQRAMQILVNDDRKRPRDLAKMPEWTRWQSTTPEGWTEDVVGHYVARSTASTNAAGWNELRYHHLVPDLEQWQEIREALPMRRSARPILVTDFYSYNTNLTIHNSRLIPEVPGEHYLARYDQDAAWLQPHWVGDLTIAATLKTTATAGSVRLELVEGGDANRCEIDLATGVATLFHGDTTLGRAETSIRAAGTYQVEFANVDNKLSLVVDEQTPFGDGLTYDDEDQGDGKAIRHPLPTTADLAPAAIATRGAAVEAGDLVIKRDIYYTQRPGSPDYGEIWDRDPPRNPIELADWLANPENLVGLTRLQPTDYPIGEGRFMMMGDNSPRSRDSRAWQNNDSAWDPDNRASWEVPRSLLTGKAFFVYWPHGKPFGPDIRLSRDFRIPFRPYWERMTWIR